MYLCLNKELYLPEDKVKVPFSKYANSRIMAISQMSKNLIKFGKRNNKEINNAFQRYAFSYVCNLFSEDEKIFGLQGLKILYSFTRGKRKFIFLLLLGTSQILTSEKMTLLCQKMKRFI